MVGPFKLVGKNLIEGPRAPLITIIVNYCCLRKMLKETETEETIVFFVTFLPLVAFQLGGGGSPAPLATPMPREKFFAHGQDKISCTCIVVY